MNRGIYQLLIRLDRSVDICVGRLGNHTFRSGFYIYTGSAQRGLSARIERHLGKTKRKHWHIDYLLEYAEIEEVMVCELDKTWECKTATMCMESGGKICVSGFGSSDCNCDSHLVFFGRKPELILKHFPEAHKYPV